MSGSKSLYFFLLFFFMCEKNPFWCENTGSFLLHDFLRSLATKDHLYYCLLPSLSLSQGWASKLYPTMANQTKISKDGKVQFEASIST